MHNQTKWNTLEQREFHTSTHLLNTESYYATKLIKTKTVTLFKNFKSTYILSDGTHTFDMSENLS